MFTAWNRLHLHEIRNNMKCMYRMSQITVVGSLIYLIRSKQTSLSKWSIQLKSKSRFYLPLLIWCWALCSYVLTQSNSLFFSRMFQIALSKKKTHSKNKQPKFRWKSRDLYRTNINLETARSVFQQTRIHDQHHRTIKQSSSTILWYNLIECVPARANIHNFSFHSINHHCFSHRSKHGKTIRYGAELRPIHLLLEISDSIFFPLQSLIFVTLRHELRLMTYESCISWFNINRSSQIPFQMNSIDFETIIVNVFIQFMLIPNKHYFVINIARAPHKQQSAGFHRHVPIKTITYRK